MAMKKINILYWTVTGIFGAFMMFSAIPNILLQPESVEILTNQLGYPKYFIPFIGVAKALGVIGILVPGFPRLKEWAYAGLFFDLLGATYSVISVGGFDPAMLTMILIFGFLFASYALYHKRKKMQEAGS
jgi:hypothetical protein